ncbi:hypothetical protein FH972_024271 [Carpinus fangiana]|uniref:VIT domain-containing protein n=1 Tax=Carpinus fangiana TaxID=176857 RepID=A0A5N6KXY3_9ROSI|nr:hypothetical protein FH972_024271 [Carpinus fangiana]
MHCPSPTLFVVAIHSQTCTKHLTPLTTNKYCQVADKPKNQAAMASFHGHICGCYYLQQQIRYYLPQVDLKTHTTIQSSAYSTVLTQTYVNPLAEKALDKIRYTFPLYDGVSVVDFECRTGQRVIKGLVKERREAKATFDAAVERGETAGLLEQLPEASDVFTTTVSNIPPGSTVQVTIRYVGELKHDAEVDGLRLTIPTAIAPRYGSSYIPGRLLSEGTSFSSKSSEKPEIIFIADRSGSMDGNIPVLVSALRVFIKSLSPGLRFNICSFGSHSQLLWPKSKKYDQDSMNQALRHIETFSANFGGTETLGAVKQAIESRYGDISTELMLLTDGDIWQQEEFFGYLNEQVSKTKGAVRLFTLGIGGGVSHALIEALHSSTTSDEDGLSFEIVDRSRKVSARAASARPLPPGGAFSAPMSALPPPPPAPSGVFGAARKKKMSSSLFGSAAMSLFGSSSGSGGGGRPATASMSRSRVALASKPAPAPAFQAQVSTSEDLPSTFADNDIQAVFGGAPPPGSAESEQEADESIEYDALGSAPQSDGSASWGLSRKIQNPTGGWPSDSSKLTPQTLLERIIAAQTFDGFWKHNDVPWQDMSITPAKLAILGDEKHRNDLLVTAVVVLYLEERMADERDAWELIVDKARDWVEGLQSVQRREAEKDVWQMAKDVIDV